MVTLQSHFFLLTKNLVTHPQYSTPGERLFGWLFTASVVRLFSAPRCIGVQQ